MLKKTITYKDFNDEEITEDFYFNLNKSELMQLELDEAGGLTAMIEKIVNTKDAPSILKVFKKIIAKAYGEKSADGKRFIKSEELSTAFEQTNAYDELFMELLSNPEEASAFINGLMPADLREAAAKTTKKKTASAE